MLIDEYEGIRFRGYSIPELQSLLPSHPSQSEGEPLPEGLLWLLMTGEIPNQEQVRNVSMDLQKRQEIPGYVFDTIKVVENYH